MKFFKIKRARKEKNLKDEYQKMVERFGAEQLKKLHRRGLRLPVVML